MIENEDGTVAGSLNRARIKELHDQSKDADLKAYYRGLLGESDEGRAIDEDESDKKSGSKSESSSKSTARAGSPKSEASSSGNDKSA